MAEKGSCLIIVKCLRLEKVGDGLPCAIKSLFNMTEAFHLGSAHFIESIRGYLKRLSLGHYPCGARIGEEAEYNGRPPRVNLDYNIIQPGGEGEVGDRFCENCAFILPWSYNEGSFSLSICRTDCLGIDKLLSVVAKSCRFGRWREATKNEKRQEK